MKSLMRQAARIVHRLLLNPNVRNVSQKLPVLRNLNGSLYRTHPFDETYGVDTSGWYPTELLQSKEVASNLIVIYVGSQPSITRGALSTLPDITDYTFVDLGCGNFRSGASPASNCRRNLPGSRDPTPAKSNVNFQAARPSRSSRETRWKNYRRRARSYSTSIIPLAAN
jgi:hypothetical protein